jgi:hypothetical protein
MTLNQRNSEIIAFLERRPEALLMLCEAAHGTALMSFKTLGSLALTTAKAGIIGNTRQLAMEVAAIGFAPIRFLLE